MFDCGLFAPGWIACTDTYCFRRFCSVGSCERVRQVARRESRWTGYFGKCSNAGWLRRELTSAHCPFLMRPSAARHGRRQEGGQEYGGVRCR